MQTPCLTPCKPPRRPPSEGGYTPKGDIPTPTGSGADQPLHLTAKRDGRAAA